jgi:Ca2+-transporting ATPase
MEALKRMAVSKAIVIRDGQKHILSSPELVPGDVVEIEAGHVVPADIRLTEVFSLRVDESSLTGESVPADKNTDLVHAEHPSPGPLSRGSGCRRPV